MLTDIDIFEIVLDEVKKVSCWWRDFISFFFIIFIIFIVIVLFFFLWYRGTLFLVAGHYDFAAKMFCLLD